MGGRKTDVSECFCLAQEKWPWKGLDNNSEWEGQFKAEGFDSDASMLALILASYVYGGTVLKSHFLQFKI